MCVAIVDVVLLLLWLMFGIVAVSCVNLFSLLLLLCLFRQHTKVDLRLLVMEVEFRWVVVVVVGWVCKLIFMSNPTQLRLC